ncbi:MAG: ATP-binding protein [Actinomycetota bacterium]|nr:ATP-binding protein [Actinomycetota bacterium]
MDRPPASDRTVTLAIPPQSGLVRFVRLVGVALARLNGIQDESIDDIRLAISEACNRAVAAHRSTALDAPLTVEISGGRGLVVTVRDCQPLPAASGMQAADLLRRSAGDPGGTGPDDSSRTSWFDDLFDDDSVLPEAIGLISGLADDLTVQTGPAGTSVTMAWHIAA